MANRERVKVGNVEDDGRVSLAGPWSPLFGNFAEFAVYVVGVPHETAIGLSGGEEYYLEATIDRIVGNYNYFINIENVLLLNYRKIDKQ